MIFYLVCFLGHCSDGACDFFWYHRAAFHGGVRTILVSTFWLWSSVHIRAMMSFHEFFFFSSRYDINNLFFIVNYCKKKSFSLYLLLMVFYHIIKLIEFIKLNQVSN